jgi:hypothetical protein
MAKTEGQAPVVHPEAHSYPLPSGGTLHLKPEAMTGELYMKFQSKTVGFVAAGKGTFSGPTQWLATQIFDFQPKGGERGKLDLVTLTQKLSFKDGARLNQIIGELQKPPEAEPGKTPSGISYEIEDIGINHYWTYQDKVGSAIDKQTGRIKSGEAMVGANVWLASKLVKVDGEPVSEGWLNGATFQDAAFVLSQVGKLLSEADSQAP